MKNNLDQLLYSLKKLKPCRGSLPVYFLIHNHKGLQSYCNDEIQNAMTSMICKLRSNPSAIEDLLLSIISCAPAKQIIPLQNLSELATDKIIFIDNGSKFKKMGSSFLKLLCDCIDKEVISNSIRGNSFNDALPLVFILHATEMSDNFDWYLKKLKERKLGLIINFYPQNNSFSILKIEELKKSGNLGIIFDCNYKILFSYILDLLLFAIDYDIKDIPKLPSELYILY